MSHDIKPFKGLQLNSQPYDIEAVRKNKLSIKASDMKAKKF